MKAILLYLARRLREPSTITGLSVLSVLFGLPPGLVEPAALGVAAVASVIAVLLPDPKKPAVVLPAPEVTTVTPAEAG